MEPVDVVYGLFALLVGAVLYSLCHGLCVIFSRMWRSR